MKASLNFINRSNDNNNSRIVIFQHPIDPDSKVETIAWKVIENCSTGSYHPFDYDYNLEVSVSDSYGNFTKRMSANPGDLFKMIRDNSGDSLIMAGKSAVPTEIQVANNLSEGSVDAYCYRSGKLVCRKKNIVPLEMAVFELEAAIYVGIISDVEEGETMNSAILSENYAAFTLARVKSADLVMSGGGSGKESTPYTFKLENIVEF